MKLLLTGITAGGTGFGGKINLVLDPLISGCLNGIHVKMLREEARGVPGRGGY